MSSFLGQGRDFRAGDTCAVYECSFNSGGRSLSYVGLTVVPASMSVLQALNDRKERLIHPPRGSERVAWMRGPVFDERSLKMRRLKEG